VNTFEKSAGAERQAHASGAETGTAREPIRTPVTPSEGEGVRGDGVEDEGVEGERGIPSVNRVRSMQSRVTSVLGVACLSVIGFALLGWYYTQALTRQHRAVRTAESHVTERARSEMTLPPLGHITAPRVVAPDPASASPEAAHEGSTLEALVGPAPELPANGPGGHSDPFASPPAYGAPGTPYGPPARESRAQLITDRRLGGPVFSSALARTPTAAAAPAGSGAFGSASAPLGAGALGTPGNSPSAEVLATPVATASSGTDAVAAVSTPSAALGPRLRASVTAAVQAQLLPTQRFLLPKGAFLDCTLETAIDSTLPGLVTCVTATDAFGVDGTTVLIERGSKMVGETQGQMAPGAARVFVLWTEVRTPTGVVAALASPGTDELGRAGLPGEVHRHFFERFGAAMLISVLDGAVQSATRPSGNGGAVIYNPSASEALATEALKGTVNIPPTLTKHQGDRIQVLVARDLDFRSVYDLRTAGTPH
jgi:type IV secretion system protein VirB10